MRFRSGLKSRGKEKELSNRLQKLFLVVKKMDSKVLKQRYWGNVMILVSHALCSQDMKQTLRIYVIFLFRAATEKGLTEHPRPSLSSPPPLFLPLSLFYFFSISRFLLTLLWQSAQPQGQRTEGLAGVFVMKKEKGRAGEREGKDGQDGELEMGRIRQEIKMTVPM